MEYLSPFLTIIVMLLVVIGVVVGSRIRSRRRRQGMADWAQRRGWRFRADPGERERSSLAKLPLFERGRRRRIENLVTGELDDCSLWLFDYRFVIGSGQHSSTRRQTVMLMEHPDLDLPAFELRPESMLDKIGAHLGQQDIDFDSHPEFSAQYLLRGESASRVKRLFGPDVRRHFENHPGWSVEGRGRQFIGYRQRTLCAPDHLDTLVEDGRRLIRLFRS